MRITGEQARILDGYTCERLTSKEDNRDLIKSFVNQRGYLLVNYLQEYGWEEDKAGKTAFYLIKNPEGTPCIFFALKCGALFQPLNEDELRKAIEEARQFLQLPQGTYIEWTEDYSDVLPPLIEVGASRSSTLMSTVSTSEPRPSDGSHE